MLRYDFIVRPTKRRIRLYDVMAVNAVETIQSLPSPYCKAYSILFFSTPQPQPKVILLGDCFYPLLRQTLIPMPCGLSNSVFLCLKPEVAWSCLQNIVLVAIRVANTTLSTTSAHQQPHSPPRLITALIYLLEHSYLQWSTLIQTSACLRISLTSSKTLPNTLS